MAPQETTNVTIDGSRTTLVFGYRYNVRYGADDAVIRDAILDRREPNGDLSFLVLPDAEGANGGRRRVRPSTIDSLTGSGLEYRRRPAELASRFLERAERELGRWYTAWIGTEDGQLALADVADEERALRRESGRRTVSAGIVAIANGSASADDVLAKLRADGAIPPSEDELEAALERGVALAESLATELDHDHDAIAARVAEEIPELRTPTRVSAILPAVVPSRTGRPYAERNQVWRCGSCKRRTRASFCENGHPRVEAPAGKRRESRS